MYRKILLRTDLNTKDKLKRLLNYYALRRGARIPWKRRYSRVFSLYPEYKKPIQKNVEKNHCLYWKPFQKYPNKDTLRVCSNISGISNYKYIPEEIFNSDIAPTLNRTDCVKFLTYKSFYNHWFPGNIFPRDYFHNIDGIWYDKDLNRINFDEVKNIAKKLDYKVVLKPNRDSYGGRGIYFPENYNDLLKLCESGKNFLVQEKIKQHNFFEQFNPHGLNTIRVNIYRSVKDDKIKIINTVLRMGVGGSLDNETDGGIVTLVRKDGFLNGFALDKYGKKYINHPDTGLDFTKKITGYEELKENVFRIAEKFFYARIFSFDLCYDKDENWRMIEINTTGITIRFAQYHGVSFFDEFTDEVHEYCRRNHWTLTSDL